MTDDDRFVPSVESRCVVFYCLRARSHKVTPRVARLVNDDDEEPQPDLGHTRYERSLGARETLALAGHWAEKTRHETTRGVSTMCLLSIHNCATHTSYFRIPACATARGSAGGDGGGGGLRDRPPNRRRRRKVSENTRRPRQKTHVPCFCRLSLSLSRSLQSRFTTKRPLLFLTRRDSPRAIFRTRYRALYTDTRTYTRYIRMHACTHDGRRLVRTFPRSHSGRCVGYRATGSR